MRSATTTAPFPGPDWVPWDVDGHEFMMSPDGYRCVRRTRDGWDWAIAVVVQREGRCLAPPEMPEDLVRLILGEDDA